MTDLQERGCDGDVHASPDVQEAAVHCLLSFLEEGDGEIGFEPRAARRWLDECLLLAAHEPGQCAADLGAAPLLAAVYRDLESIERWCRAELLRGLVRVLSRREPTSVGSAALDLIAPLSSGAADALRAGFRREALRHVSARLFDCSTPQRGEPSDGPVGVVREFATLAAALNGDPRGGFEERLADAEARLAYEGGDAAGADLVALSGMLDEASSPVVAQDVIERLRAAAAFAAGDDATVLEVLDGGVLSLDRSASLGAMRAASSHRRGCGQSDDTERCIPVRDEFTGIIDADDRRRIARFLAVATSENRREEVETA